MIPVAACSPPPAVEGLEGEQHLQGLVDRGALAAQDQRGVQRPQGAGCDAGAVELAGAPVATASRVRPAAQAVGDDEDSPWPDTEALPANVRAVEREVRGLERKVEAMDASADTYEDWQACLRLVPVSEYGDPDGAFGYRYDERDGSGEGMRPALAVNRTSRRGRADYMFLSFERRAGCRSEAPQAGGTADAATARIAAAPRRGLRQRVAALERRVKRLKRASRRIERVSERFDEWQSCASQIPVTEYGDPDGGFGFRFGSRDSSESAFRPALAIDRSDWDDPDYFFLAFVGRDRPGRPCQNEPGEAVD